jgi:hypothetical protein
MSELKNLVHFYHVFADGHWQDIADNHFAALETFGLMDQLNELFLGVVGTPEKRLEAKRKLPGVVVAEADQGWEQVTLEALHDFAQHNSANIFYAHTKGAWSNSELANQWRASMTYDTVTRWRECVTALDSVDAAGPFWIHSPLEDHKDHKRFFGGNFWWARSQYVAQLPPLKNEHRYQAEGWIGLEEPSVKDMRPGQPTWGNFWRMP